MELLKDWQTLLNLWLRWIHVVFGILWIGHLYFFNFVNANVAKTYDAATKKAVVPQLMPRALFWFRWGAAFTWVTGVLLLGIVVYMGGVLDPKVGNTTAVLVGVASLVVGFGVYEVLWRSPVAKNERVGAAISFLLIVAANFGYSQLFGGRAAWIHLGAMLGTIMAANVWMRIWPSQRKIIAAAAGGPAVDAAVPALAALRSKHNVYMSVPLILTMVSNHYPTWYGEGMSWIILSVLVLIGWGFAMRMYKVAASEGPTKY